MVSKMYHREPEAFFIGKKLVNSVFVAWRNPTFLPIL